VVGGERRVHEDEPLAAVERVGGEAEVHESHYRVFRVSQRNGGSSSGEEWNGREERDS
jgi:hypothetical protein